MAHRAHKIRGLFPLIASLSLVGVLAASCDDATEATLSDASPCANELKEQCGDACLLDDECPAGMHCRPEGTCGADCVQGDTRCGDATCSDRGRCGGGSTSNGGGFTVGTGGSGGATSTSSGMGGACGAVTISFEPQIPTVVLLIDQSGSMTSNFGGQPRWDVVYDVLMDPNSGVVQGLESEVRFGLALYSYTSGPVCPALVKVTPPALNNHGAIDAVYSQENPSANTPTGDSLAAITPSLAAFAEPGPKLIILATDGDPDRCEDPDGHDQISMDETTDAAQAAYLQGIETVVIAVGNQVSAQHQQDVANAGSGRPVPSPFPCNPQMDPANCAQTYQPANQQALVAAFNSIISGQRTCVFTLDGAVIPGKECDGDVRVNGMLIPCNDPDGWQLNSPTEIEFLGTTCDTITNDPSVTVEASFPCDAISQPPK
jgi:hypothetical protein